MWMLGVIIERTSIRLTACFLEVSSCEMLAHSDDICGNCLRWFSVFKLNILSNFAVRMWGLTCREDERDTEDALGETFDATAIEAPVSGQFTFPNPPLGLQVGVYFNQYENEIDLRNLKIITCCEMDTELNFPLPYLLLVQRLAIGWNLKGGSGGTPTEFRMYWSLLASFTTTKDLTVVKWTLNDIFSFYFLLGLQVWFFVSGSVRCLTTTCIRARADLILLYPRLQQKQLKLIAAEGLRERALRARLVRQVAPVQKGTIYIKI